MKQRKSTENCCKVQNSEAQIQKKTRGKSTAERSRTKK